jgi:hypothetical protein
MQEVLLPGERMDLNCRCCSLHMELRVVRSIEYHYFEYTHGVRRHLSKVASA